MTVPTFNCLFLCRIRFNLDMALFMAVGANIQLPISLTNSLSLAVATTLSFSHPTLLRSRQNNLC